MGVEHPHGCTIFNGGLRFFCNSPRVIRNPFVLSFYFWPKMLATYTNVRCEYRYAHWLHEVQCTTLKSRSEAVWAATV